jgi:hypothetical protein
MIDLKKYQRDFDVYSDPLSAKAKSQAMGLNGAIHVYDVDGQAYYMPGATHKEYLETMEFEDYSEEDLEEVTEDRMTEALRAVVAEIMGKSFEDWGEPVAKAEYQGEEVPLNQPRRLSGGNKKFEVFVRDGDKVKRVTFGDPDMEIRRDDDEARASFRARHNCDSKKDKTTAGYWSCRLWEKDTTVSEATKSDKTQEDFKILKLDEEQKIVYGWASVTTYKGELVVDRQGDIIRTETLHKAINEFMENVRVGKLMHSGEQVGQIIHSFPVTKDICAALGIQSDMEGWITGYKVYDDDLWNDVKSGKYGAFSIGGAAQKEEFHAD